MPAIVTGHRMTSRERVRRAFAHQEPDRVPLNYVANAGIDRRLKDHFRLAPDDSEGLRRALHIDFRGIGAPYTGPRLHAEAPHRSVSPEWGMRCMWIEHASGGYWDYCDFPLADADDDTIANWPLPSPDDYDYDRVRAACRGTGDYFVTVGNPGLVDLMNWTGMLRGVEAMMLALAEEHEATLRLIDRKLALQLEVTRRTLEVAAGRVDLVWTGEDLGSQRGPLISRDMFERLIRPRHQPFIDLARRHHLPVMMHSCGSSSWSFDDLLAMGITAIDTLQPEPKDMAPAYLKARFGDRLTFHGCISTAGPVAFGTVDETIANVRDTLKVMMPHGGYCCSPTHALQDNSPTANVLALFEAAQKYGRYTGTPP